MIPSYAVLNTEVTTDPLGLGYAGQSDASVAALMNTANIPVVATVPMSAVLIWAAPGILATITAGQTQAAAIAGVPATTIQSICQAAIKMLNLPVPLDLTNPAINGAQGMLQLLVAIGFITTQQLAALLALGTTQTTRALTLPGWGIPVQTPDITAARAM